MDLSSKFIDEFNNFFANSNELAQLVTAYAFSPDIYLQADMTTAFLFLSPVA